MRESDPPAPALTPEDTARKGVKKTLLSDLQGQTLPAPIRGQQLAELTGLEG
ncbi:hypothetical protein ACQEVF_44545 [Nonomuraea polychroma]|uniref:hypothetical protein n=1 Tax=Nonomuraea polychroma TaxID=46176 RepID=UPI003D92451C